MTNVTKQGLASIKFSLLSSHLGLARRRVRLNCPLPEWISGIIGLISGVPARKPLANAIVIKYLSSAYPLGYLLTILFFMMDNPQNR